jgi:hypothetical protein
MFKAASFPLSSFFAPAAAALAFPLSFLPLLALDHGARSESAAVLGWQLATILLLLGVVSRPRFRGRAAVPAGLVGVLVWVALVPLLVPALDHNGGWGAGVSLSLVWLGSGLAVWLGSGLAFAAAAGWLVERSSFAPRAALSGPLVRMLALGLALGAAVCAASVAFSGARPRAITGAVVGWVEVPALATVVRERFAEVEVVAVGDVRSDRGPDCDPGECPVTARLALVAPGGSMPEAHVLRESAGAGCTFPVPWSGRTVEIVRHPDAYVVHWSRGPHGEVFGGCTFDRATLAFVPTEEVARHAPAEASWALAAAATFGLAMLFFGAHVRRRHARLAPMPEVRVSAPGLATMPDGSPALVPESIPVGTSLVVLRIADASSGYRSDARTAVEEHAVGEKDALLAALSRRALTIELFALTGALWFVEWPLGAVLAGATLTW